MADLATQAIRSTVAVGAANIVARIVGYAGTLYLLRWLPPGSFGDVDYTAAVLIVCGSLTNWGMAQGAVHRSERVDETFSTFLVLRLAMVATMYALVGIGALAFRHSLAEGLRLDVLAVIAAALIADAACEAMAARLTRSMQFVRLSAVEVTSLVLATGASVVMAWRGFGIWAIVVNRFGVSAVRVIGLWLVRVEPTRMRFHLADARWLFAFGLPLWLGGFATTLILWYDRLIIRHLRDERVLGYYGLAYGLALIPLTLVAGSFGRVAFPLYARLQSDRARLSEAFRIVAGTVLRLVVPMAVGMAAAMPDLVVVMKWTQWTPMVSIFRCLAVYAIVRPMMDNAGALLTAIGRPKTGVQMLAAQAAALVVLCPPLTWKWGAEGAAASVCAVTLGGLSAWLVWSLPRFVDIAYRHIFLWPIVSGAVAAAAGAAVEAWAGLSPGWASGALKLAAVGVTYVAAIFALDGRQAIADLRSAYRNAFGS